MTDDAGARPQPPPYLTERIVDLIEPRFIVPDYRRFMAPYHDLGEIETNVRFQTRMALDPALRLWLRAIALCFAPFRRRFEWPTGVSDAEKEALELREDFLGLAGGASKPTLDALTDGYYWSAYGMIRSLLETCRRVGYIRLRPIEALPYFQAPTESPIGPDGERRPNRAKPIPFEVIRDAYADAPAHDQARFTLINAGITHMNAGSHPSPEGLLQVYLQEGVKVFGPVFDRYWASFGLKWGIFANLILLAELDALQPQGADWLKDYAELESAYSAWQATYNAEFVDNR